MLEFIVPEPAAFYRYAMSKLPEEVNKLVKPDPPGYCLSDGKTFHALEVKDITRYCYLDWVTKYNVQDVSPPPSSFINVSQAKTIKNEELKKMTILTFNLTVGIADAYFDIPAGYIPLKAYVNLQGDGVDKDTWMFKFTIKILVQKISVLVAQQM